MEDQAGQRQKDNPPFFDAEPFDPCYHSLPGELAALTGLFDGLRWKSKNEIKRWQPHEPQPTSHTLFGTSAA